MSFFRYFVSIFVSPGRVFDDIRESKVSWWQPWIIVSIIFMATSWLAAPIQQAMLEMNPQFATEDVGSKSGMMRIFQVIMAPVGALIICVVVAGISYVMVTLMSKQATFKKYFTLILFTNIVFAIGYLLSTVFVRARGLEDVATVEDLQLSLSLRVLALDGGPFLRGLLGSFEFFSIWGLVLVAMGLRRVFDLRPGQAVACVVPLWLMYATVGIVGELMVSLGG